MIYVRCKGFHYLSWTQHDFTTEKQLNVSLLDEELCYEVACSKQDDHRVEEDGGGGQLPGPAHAGQVHQDGQREDDHQATGRTTEPAEDIDSAAVNKPSQRVNNHGKSPH